MSFNIDNKSISSSITNSCSVTLYCVLKDLTLLKFNDSTLTFHYRNDISNRRKKKLDFSQELLWQFTFATCCIRNVAYGEIRQSASVREWCATRLRDGSIAGRRSKKAFGFIQATGSEGAETIQW